MPDVSGWARQQARLRAMSQQTRTDLACPVGGGWDIAAMRLSAALYRRGRRDPWVREGHRAYRRWRRTVTPTPWLPPPASALAVAAGRARTSRAALVASLRLRDR